ncbi:MAG TPA: SRPBCC family protein [Thermodesulfovibrionales bacterium]|jgi:hypothetical protein|nr:SRPBCC family protein [Thermodesulfovibrionales bacterium]
MIIEESIVIHATPKRVWETFADLTCWNHWNTVLKNVSPKRTEILSEGGKVKFCIYPFNFPVYFEPNIESVVPGRRIVWSSGKFGISARHEFLFQEAKEGVIVISKEVFSAIGLKTLRFLFPDWRLRDLTISFLKDLKTAAEK